MKQTLTIALQFHNSLGLLQTRSRQTKQSNIIVLPRGSDLSIHLHMITSPISKATSEAYAARLHLIIFHQLMSHNKLRCHRYRWTVSHIIAIICCLVSQEAATITNNHGRTVDDFQQLLVVTNADSTFIRLSFTLGLIKMWTLLKPLNSLSIFTYCLDSVIVYAFKITFVFVIT